PHTSETPVIGERVAALPDPPAASSHPRRGGGAQTTATRLSSPRPPSPLLGFHARSRVTAYFFVAYPTSNPR
uniref:Clade I nitrous oxide reductase n=1 Tax=Mesocestoides corti TaxID=53468 RepID=A0A5K3ENY7_MESCO